MSRLSTDDNFLISTDGLINHSPEMLTKYLTAVRTAFSPFNARSGKTARNFLALLPPNARSSMAIEIKTFGRTESERPASLALKFSMLQLGFLLWLSVG